MHDALIAPTFLFRFAVPCLPFEPATWRVPEELPRECALPMVGELDQRQAFAELRAGWSPRGLSISVCVRGKKQPIVRANRDPFACDGLSVWVDTRDTPTIHRASRFCHQFLLLPQGPLPQQSPFGALVAIDRARENPRVPAQDDIIMASQPLDDGYRMMIQLRAAALTGWNPTEYPRLGFTYAIRDQELGTQTFAVGPDYPYASDRSLWGTLELIPPEIPTKKSRT